MITTLIICVTIIFCIVWITLWTKHMGTHNLPMFTYGECVWKDKVEEPTQGKTNPVGFVPAEEESSEKKSDKAVKDAIMADPITMTAALLRGEVDIDELTT
jgi:hypothetical protein